jgi:hypothetical protein
MRCSPVTLLLIILWLNSGFALAHNITYHALQGLILCLEPRSVQVTVGVDAMYDAKYEKQILERLRASLHRTLVNYQVPFVKRDECTKKDSFVFTAFYTAPEMSRNGESAYILASTTQVGSPSDFALPEAKQPETKESNRPFSSLKPKREQLAVDAILTDNVFDTVTSTLVLASGLTQSFDKLLPTVNEDAFKDLALAWWEDNPNGLIAVSMWPYLIGSILVIIVISVGLRLRHQQLKGEAS